VSDTKGDLTLASVSFPSANADPLTDLIDLAIGSATSATSPTEFLDPAVLDSALSELVSRTVLSDLSGVGSSAGVVPDSTSAAATSADPAAWLHGLEQDWINSPLGQQVGGTGPSGHNGTNGTNG
jgi:hypothetical protein